MNPSINLALFNRATTPLSFDPTAFTAALQIQFDRDFTPVWDLPVTVQWTDGPLPNYNSVVMLDSADQPGAEAYHDLENDLPAAKVFLATIKQAGGSQPVAIGHECIELVVNRYCNLWAPGLDGKTLYAYEACDAVEADEVGYLINGILMTNFLYPAWWDPTNHTGTFDHQKVLTAPFQLHSGGYAITFANGQYNQIFGSAGKLMAFGLEDRRGHRSEHIRNRLKP